MKTNPALSALRHHVSGAIARGEAQAITESPAPTSPSHTPGPWYLNPRGWVVQSTGDIITRLECSNNKEADARLIAAAPTLLEALELALVTIDGQAELFRACGAAYGIGATLQRTSAAIAKAKGGTDEAYVLQQV